LRASTASIRPAAIRPQLRHAAPRRRRIAARTIACLPALVGAWRRRGGRPSSSARADFYGFDHAALERADLLPEGGLRVINQSQLGDALTTAQPPCAP